MDPANMKNTLCESSIIIIAGKWSWGCAGSWGIVMGNFTIDLLKMIQRVHNWSVMQWGWVTCDGHQPMWRSNVGVFLLWLAWRPWSQCRSCSRRLQEVFWRLLRKQTQNMKLFPMTLTFGLPVGMVATKLINWLDSTKLCWWNFICF